MKGRDHGPARRADDVDLDRTRRLFEYISRIALLQSAVVTDIRNASSYEEVVWLGSLPIAAEVQSVARGDAGAKGDWLVVKRPRFVPPPAVSEGLAPWLDPVKVRDSSHILTLTPTSTRVTEIDSPEGGTATRVDVVHIEDEPEIQEEFDDYLPIWGRWAEEDRRLQPIHDVYSSLFTIHQRVTTLQELYEVVLGLGLVTHRRSVGQVRRHLLIARADVEMEPDSGRILVGPAGDGLGLHVEAEMLEAGESPPPDVIRNVSEHLVDLDDLFAPGAAEAVLKSWAHSSGQDARYDDSVAEPAAAEDRLVVTLAPALILRRRTRRAIVDFCDAVISGLEPGIEIPGAVRDLIERAPDDDQGLDSDAEPVLGLEPLFPLPANDEQRAIIARLEQAPGIVVEGPPGTGKSHTIANLIAHLTASGQRVLVTSHTARALTVLKAKLPAGIADLCVDVLGEGRERRDNLERSINALLARHMDPTWDPREVDERLERMREQRVSLEARRTGLLAEQRRARELEVIQHELGVGDYSGTLSSIAARVAREVDRLGWLAEGGDGPPPELLGSIPALLAAERSITPRDLELAGQAVPVLDGLPTPPEIRDALDDIERLKGATVEPVSRPVRMLAETSDETRAEIASAVSSLVASVGGAMRSPAPWVETALTDVLRGQSSRWMSLEEMTRDGLGAVDARLHELDRVRVTGITAENRGRLLEQADGLRVHLASGGHISRLGRRPQPVQAAEELLRSVRMNGAVPDAPDRLETLVRYVAADGMLGDLESGWGDLLPLSDGTLGGRRRAITIAWEQLQPIMRAHAARVAAMNCMATVPGLLAPDWMSPSAVDAVLADVDRANAVARYKASEVVLRDRLRPLQDAALQRIVSPAVTDALDAVAARDIVRYTGALEAMRDVARARDLVDRRNGLAESVGTVLPRLVSAIRADPGDASWDERLATVIQAWEWRRIQAWLRSIRAGRSDQDIAVDLADSDRRIRHLVGQITEHLAWQHTLRALTPFSRQNLMAYQASMRSYGKGTGIHAQRHLANARRFLEACQEAVPVWIMPTHMVAETIKAKPATFDVVIVDEASQSGVDASFLMWLGRKLVVVGDEKQISPDLVGIDRTAAALHAKTYLDGFHFDSVLGVDYSLFTQAAVRYGSRVRLREHFRCMPEIIEFSNRIAYQDAPLIPLRQYGSARLEPLVARYVEGGETRSAGGGKINDREAEQIVATIERLCKDPVYSGKTMGVISLLGGQQARRINDLLVRTLPPSEIADRKIRCGDAYAFQGDERDVMFLSMVAAPEPDGTRLHSLSERIFNQRFNVASSRAKDQEWLFHSVTLQDLRPEDLRHRLLSHFVAPSAPEIEEELGAIPDDVKVDPFDSVFEQLVYKAIRRRGYRVTPQVRIHGYRIDLVVTGRDRKLAVECDGDQWHGPEQYTRDMGRQRDLERCGWTFVRIRGSEFFSDPEAALEPLWDQLERAGIWPQSDERGAADAVAVPVAGEIAGPEVGVLPGDEAPPEAGDSSVIARSDEADAEMETEMTAAELDQEAAPRRVLTDVAAGLGAITMVERPALLPDEASIWSMTVDGQSRETVVPSVPSVEASSGVLVPPEPSLEESPISRYDPWEAEGPIPRPGAAGATAERLAGLLLEVVRVEGPVMVDLAFRRLIRASGGHRVSKASRRELNHALAYALRKGWLVSRDPFQGPGLAGHILRMPTGRTVVVRERGDRDLEEIPPDEVAAVARALSTLTGIHPGEALKRALLDFYGRSRLTEAASNFLDRCFSLFDDTEVRAAADGLGRGLESVRRSPVTAPLDRPERQLPQAAASVAGRAAVTRSVDEADEVAPGPPFWEIVSEIARSAMTIHEHHREAIEVLWRAVDGSTELEEAKGQAVAQGADPNWSTVARVLAANMPGRSAEFRGAATDLSYIRHWLSHSGGPALELPDVLRQLADAFEEAAEEASRDSRERATGRRCIHGRAPGRCDYIACPNHPTGGIDTSQG